MQLSTVSVELKSSLYLDPNVVAIDAYLGICLLSATNNTSSLESISRNNFSQTLNVKRCLKLDTSGSIATKILWSEVQRNTNLQLM